MHRPTAMVAPPSILPTDELRARKQALRLEARARRAALAPRTRTSASEQVAALLWERLGPPAGPVSGYWPIRDELDPRPALLRFAAAGATLALPRLQGADQPLRFLTWRPEQTLQSGKFGLSEPDPDAQPVRPALVLVPLLAFDRSGHRLGWGKGYYDRTLAALRADGAPLLAVGLAFAVQELGEVPAGPADVPLDAVVTEAGWIATAAAGV